MKLKGILFDFAGVIASDGYWVWRHENVKLSDEIDKYFMEISEQVDSAQITNNEFARLISEKSGLPIEKIWPEIKKRIIVNNELLEYMTELKKTYRIGLLSNYTYEWLDELFAEHDLAKYFDSKFISSRHGVIKPDPKAFYKALELLGTNKEETVFIDDRQYNVDAGNSLGLKSLLFTSNDQLRKDIGELVGVS